MKGAQIFALKAGAMGGEPDFSAFKAVLARELYERLKGLCDFDLSRWLAKSTEDELALF